MSKAQFRCLHRTFFLIALLWCLLINASAFGETGGRQTFDFNPAWKFTKSDPVHAQMTEFDDASWQTVSTPHTFNDVDTFDDFSLPSHKGEQNQWSGRTWYRKRFIAPSEWSEKHVYIEFEAVRQIGEVYLNGELLGVSKTGFTPFGFELTSHLKFGQPNVLAVMVDNRFMKDPMNAEPAGPTSRATGGGATDPGPGGGLQRLTAKVNEGIPERVEDLQADQIPWNNPHWHPAHGGIYRNVRLHVLDPLHISLPLYSFLQTAGPYVFATDVTNDVATIGVEIPLENHRKDDQDVQVSAEILDGSGATVLTLRQNANVTAAASQLIKLSGRLDHPKLWEPATPNLYGVICKLMVRGQLIDRCELPLGVRSARWDLKQGFFINGHHLKLHGWGQKPTDEWPGLGAAQPDWLHAYTIDLMKGAGGNFVRWGHSAAGMSQINAGDALGIIADQPGVEGESDTVRAAWTLRVEAWRDTLIYFRNNPSILIWEGGNQKVTREHGKELHDLMLQYDPNGGRAYAHRRADKITAEFMDIGIGTEGGQEIKELPVVEGEYDREESPRRVWDEKSLPNFGYPEAKGMTYDLTSEQFAVNQVSQWMTKLGSPAHAGGANWIFSDSTSGGRVPAEVARASGEVDGARLPKEAYYVCKTMFRTDPQVHIIGHWSYPPNTIKNVYVVSNADSVELKVNGKLLGTAERSNRYLFTFRDVHYESGEISAVASNGASQSLHTTSQPAALKLTPITALCGFEANGADVALFDVEAIDADGNRCPTFESRVDFRCEGPASWRGGYNSGKPNSINNTYLNLECGINRVALRSTLQAGTITLRAEAAGLRDGLVAITSQPVSLTDGMRLIEMATPSIHPAATQPSSAFADTMPLAASTRASEAKSRYIESFSYSGASGRATLEVNAREGDKAYAENEATFDSLPASLVGADHVKPSNADRRYSAVDLMQIAVKQGTTLHVAFDERLPVPSWLSEQFRQSDEFVVIGGAKMRLFSRAATSDQSLTLGSNAENAGSSECNMYIVFATGRSTP